MRTFSSSLRRGVRRRRRRCDAFRIYNFFCACCTQLAFQAVMHKLRYKRRVASIYILRTHCTHSSSAFIYLKTRIIIHSTTHVRALRRRHPAKKRSRAICRIKYVSTRARCVHERSNNWTSLFKRNDEKKKNKIARIIRCTKVFYMRTDKCRCVGVVIRCAK